jgi:hypothetical protein
LINNGFKAAVVLEDEGTGEEVTIDETCESEDAVISILFAKDFFIRSNQKK